MFGNMADMMGLMGKMKDLQSRMKEAQDQLASIVETAESGGGMVKATVNGQKTLIGLDIDKDLVNPDDKEMLQDLIVAAVNKAFERLEITHTCCKVGWQSTPRRRVSEQERDHIHWEQSELIDKLETFMKRYEDAFESNEEPILEFVNHWMEKIELNDGEYLWENQVI